MSTIPDPTEKAADATPAAQGKTAQGKAQRWRRWTVVVLVVLSSFGVFASTIAVWTHRTVYNTDAWINRVGDLPKEPAVAEALSTRLTTQVFDTIDAEGEARDVFPEKAKFLAGPLTTATQGFIAENVAKVIQTDQFQKVWIEANRLAHERLIAILKGEPGAVQSVDGKVYLNLLPIVGRVLDRVHQVAPDLVGGGATPPTITTDTPVDEALQQLSDYLGVQVPADFGQILVFQSDQLAQAQSALREFSRLVLVTVLATLALIALTVWLALDRRRVVIWLGLGTVTSLLLAWALARVLSNQLLAAIEDGQVRDAARVVATSFAGSLRALTIAVIVIGALAAVAAFAVGESSSARALRRLAVNLAGRGAAKGEQAEPVRGAVWVEAHATGLRVAGLVGALLVMATVDLTWGSFLVLLVLFGLYQLAVEALTRSAGASVMPGVPSQA